MSERHSSFMLTINNPTAADEEDIARARQKGWKVDGQLEKGENGTLHYQLLVSPGQQRFSTIKKAFPRAHVEVTRNVAAAKLYVGKEETRVCSLPAASEKYPSLSKFWHLVAEKFLEWDWLQMHEDDWLGGFSDEFYKFFEFDELACCHSRRMKEDLMMLAFQNVIDHLIEEGYHVEHFYSPPNISVFKKFHGSLIRRSISEINAQTDRQTDALDSAVIPVVEEYTHVSQEVEVPCLSEEASQSSQA